MTAADAADLRLVVVAGTPQLVRAARSLGVHTTLVRERTVEGAESDADAIVEVDDLTDHSALSRRLARLDHGGPPTHVLSLTEVGLLPAAAVAESLGLGGNSLATVEALQDKRRTRAVLDATGLSPVRHAAVATAEDLVAFSELVDGPIILKPADGSGSSGVVRLANATDAAAAWPAWSATSGCTAIAEEYLDGPELSVESFTAAGRHHVLAVTRKHLLPGFVERGHTLPADLGDDDTRAVHALVHRFLDVVGVAAGPAHTEVRMTSAGPRIIESHSRIGGDKIRELLRRVLGLDVVALTVGCALGLTEPPGTVPPADGAAAIRFLVPEPGTVEAIRIASEGADDVHLDVEVGDVVRPVRSSGDRAGYVIASGADEGDVDRRVERLAASVEIVTSPVASVDERRAG